MSIIKRDGKTSEQEGINQTELTNFKIVTDPSGNPLPSNAQIISDGTTDRVLLGIQKNGFGTGKNFGFKVSQEGYDVKTCADSKLAMSSAFNNFKIVLTGTSSIAIPNPGYTSTAIITHNLGYAPSCLVYGESGGYSWALPYYDMNASPASYIIFEYSDFSIDTTKLYINWAKHAAAGSMGSGDIITLRYYLFREVSSSS